MKRVTTHDPDESRGAPWFETGPAWNDDGGSAEGDEQDNAEWDERGSAEWDELGRVVPPVTRRANAAQPRLPSISSSTSLLSSTAYSMGNSRVIGSMKPETMSCFASSSPSPRDWR